MDERKQNKKTREGGEIKTGESYKEKITSISFMFGLSVLFFDALQWLLVWAAMDWLVTIFATMTYGVWLVAIKKVCTIKELTAAASGEIVPGLGTIIPAWTALFVYLRYIKTSTAGKLLAQRGLAGAKT